MLLCHRRVIFPENNSHPFCNFGQFWKFRTSCLSTKLLQMIATYFSFQTVKLNWQWPCSKTSSAERTVASKFGLEKSNMYLDVRKLRSILYSLRIGKPKDIILISTKGSGHWWIEGRERKAHIRTHIFLLFEKFVILDLPLVISMFPRGYLKCWAMIQCIDATHLPL